MINFLRQWTEEIAIAVIIVSIFELILPNGHLKKYIKVVLGIYIVFCMISPFVNSGALYKLENLDVADYTEDVNEIAQTEVNQESMDLRLQKLYIDELKKDIKKKLNENGYEMDECKIDADLQKTSDNPGIHKIDLTIHAKTSNIEKVEIDIKKDKQYEDQEEFNSLKEILANYYEISLDCISIKKLKG